MSFSHSLLRSACHLCVCVLHSGSTINLSTHISAYWHGHSNPLGLCEFCLAVCFSYFAVCLFGFAHFCFHLHRCLPSTEMIRALSVRPRNFIDSLRSALADKDIRRVLLPACVGDTHWVLVLVDFASGTIACYDSLAGASGAEAAITPFFKLISESFASSQPWCLRLPDCPKQVKCEEDEERKRPITHACA
jgi:hypothetical protein